MSWVRTILREVFGLFVDDGSFAISILVWIGVVWLAFPRFDVLPSWAGIAFFIGLASILIESTTRRARR